MTSKIAELEQECTDIKILANSNNYYNIHDSILFICLLSLVYK